MSFQLSIYYSISVSVAENVTTICKMLQLMQYNKKFEKVIDAWNFIWVSLKPYGSFSGGGQNQKGGGYLINFSSNWMISVKHANLFSL